MKKYNINDNLDFWQNSGKSISWLFNNKWNYLDWCFKNIEDFVITNNDNLISDNSDDYKIKDLELQLKKNKKYIDYLKDNYFLLEKQLNKYKVKEPVFYDKSNNKFYNCFLNEIENKNFDIRNWFQLSNINYYSKSASSSLWEVKCDEITIIYENTKLIINLNNFFISKDFIINISWTEKYDWPDDFQQTSNILHTNEWKLFVITRWVLDLNNTWDALQWWYKRIWWSREDWDFNYWSTVTSYINEWWYNKFIKDKCKDINNEENNFF